MGSEKVWNEVGVVSEGAAVSVVWAEARRL